MKEKRIKGRKKTASKQWIFKKGPRNLQSSIDHDYLHKLTEEEKEWLANFDDMYYTGSKKGFEHVHGRPPEKGELTKSYERNNKRNRDIYGAIQFFDQIEGPAYLKVKNDVEEAKLWEEIGMSEEIQED